MKKKIILITFFLLIVFIIFNYKVFLGNYYFFNANSNYLSNNFTGALDGYNNSLKYLIGSNIDYNKGNTYYKIGENEKDLNKKIDNYKESLNLYNNILEKDLNNKKKENPDFRFNYEFVKKKLEELQEQQEQEQNKEENEKQEEEKQEDEQNGEQKDKQEQQKGDKDNTENELQNQGEDEKENKQEGDKENLDEKKDNNTAKNEESNLKEQEAETSKSEISPEELKQIENYIENLKQEEKYNREYLNNVNPTQNNPFFDSIFDRGGEKDW